MIEVLSDPRSFQTRHGSRVAIVGGGMLGTTLALRYGQAGRVVTLFESSERVERRGFASLASTDRSLCALLKELDLLAGVRWAPAPSLGIRFGVIEGGRARIVETLCERARRSGVDIRLGTPVTKIEREGLGFAVHTGGFAGGEIGNFDEVVLTVPAPVASQLVPALSQHERLMLADTGYVGIINVSFTLSQSPGQRYISRPERGGDQFTLIDPTALRPNGDRNVVYVTRPLAATDRLFVAEDREVIENFARALPGAAHITGARVLRAPHAFSRAQSQQFTSSIPGLSIVNAAHMGAGRHHLERTAMLATTVFRNLCAEVMV